MFGYAHIVIIDYKVWDETIIEILFFLIYVCEIKVEGYATFLYELVYVYSILLFYVCVEVYVNLRLDMIKKF